MTSISSSSLASGHLPDLAQLLSLETVDEAPEIFPWQQDQLDAAAASPLHAFNVPRSIPPQPPPLPPQPLYQPPAPPQPPPLPPHPLTNLSYSNRNQIPTNETNQFVHSYSSVAPQNISPQNTVLIGRTPYWYHDWHHVHSALAPSTRKRWKEERKICEEYRPEEQRLRATGHDIALKQLEQAKFSNLELCRVEYRAIERDLRQQYGHPLVEDVLNSIESELASQREAPFRGETQQVRLPPPPPPPLPSQPLYQPPQQRRLPPPPHLLTNPPHSDSHQTHQCVSPDPLAVPFESTHSLEECVYFTLRQAKLQCSQRQEEVHTKCRSQEKALRVTLDQTLESMDSEYSSWIKSVTDTQGQMTAATHQAIMLDLQNEKAMAILQYQTHIRDVQRSADEQVVRHRREYIAAARPLRKRYTNDVVDAALHRIEIEFASQREAPLREKTQPPHSANASMPATTTSSKRSHSDSSAHDAMHSLCALKPAEPSAKRPKNNPKGHT